MRRSGNQDQFEHMINDVKILRKCVDFAHIVQCYGYWFMEEEVWIILELMTTSFDQLLKRFEGQENAVPEAVVGKVAVAIILWGMGCRKVVIKYE